MDILEIFVKQNQLNNKKGMTEFQTTDHHY